MQKLALLLFMAALSACGGGGGADNTGTGATNPVRSLQDKLQGVWQQRGYGVTVRVSGSSVERFDTTSQTCFLTEKTDLDELAGLQLSEDESTFAIRPTELDFAEHYYKTDSLPAPATTLSRTTLSIFTNTSGTASTNTTPFSRSAMSTGWRNAT